MTSLRVVTRVVSGLARFASVGHSARSGAMEKVIEKKSTNSLSYDWKAELIALLIAAFISSVMVLAWIYKTNA